MPKKPQRPRLETSWASAAEFKSAFEQREDGSILRVDVSEARLEVGAPVAVVCNFPADDRAFTLHADVQSVVDGVATFKLVDPDSKRELLLLTWLAGDSVAYRRRRDPRIDCSLDARITDHRDTFEATAVDIGAGGVRVVTDWHLELGQTVQLELSFPRSTEWVQGRVVSVVRGREQGASLEFLFESRDQKDRIALLVARLG